ncbi:DUF4232 domain-containing protein [Streptomyces sp. NPDC049040]|uniref:DUF4232 domain-containing protein n=1 Tax=Streptomyces sp. NPDC049040 TaxID=3365593 RepID=UPI003720F117
MRTSLVLPAVLAGALLLTACGTEVGTGADTRPVADGTGLCTPPADPEQLAQDGVEITSPEQGSLDCGPQTPGKPRIGFQATNRGSQPMTYTITFEVRTASGEGLGFPVATVRHVAPGQTVKASTGITDAVAGRQAPASVRIHQVRSVPSDEAPVPSGPCPPSGIRVTADQGDAAMGLRVVGLHLENCSTRPYRLDGFPRIQLSDEKHEAITGVAVLHGSGGITTGTDFDDPVRAMTLAPGERATSGLMWRNTVTNGDPVDVPYVRVTAAPGAQPVTVTPELDLGTTGKLGVAPWKKDKASR